jgi:hypothetical protein
MQTCDLELRTEALVLGPFVGGLDSFAQSIGTRDRGECRRRCECEGESAVVTSALIVVSVNLE